MSLTVLETKIYESFSDAIRYGKLLQAGNGKVYYLRCKAGECQLIDLLRTDKIHIRQAILKPETLVAAHCHGERETFFIVKGEMWLYCQKQCVILEEQQQYYIDADIPHASYFPVASEVITIFCPPDTNGSMLYGTG